jgi:tetratricopeptide (TPR) repeat protein
LDNLEHLAGETGLLADFLTPILMGVPGLTFLVTSRVRLNLYEEWRFELAGLEVPVERDTTDLEKYSAVQLFIQRARQAGLNVSMERDLPVIGQICHLLAGLPLGIELAAGWVRTYTCDQIAAEIEQNLDFLSTTIQNVPERHRTLQVAFEHSWRLLPVEAKQIFARLTIFRGGFVQEAAEFVAGASRTTLAGLVDNSMLHVVGGRFQMNELLRQFGTEKLQVVGAANVHEHHAAYFATFIEQRQQHKWTAEEPPALNEISLELKNILAGWHWVISHLSDPSQIAAVLNLIGQYTPMLAYYYEQKSRFHEGFQLFHNAARKIEATDGNSSPQRRVALAIVQAAEATLRFHLSQFSEVEKLFQDSLEIFRQNDNHYETAVTLARLGMTSNRMGRYKDSNRYLQESLALFRQLEDRIGSAEALNGLGILAISEEKFDDGWQLLQKSLAVYRESGYKRGIARALSNLGTVNVRRGNYNQVLPLYDEALAAARAINDVMVIAAINSNLGSISRILGSYDESLRYYEESLIMFREMDERRWITASLNGLGETLIEMEQFDAAQQRMRQALEISTAIQSVPDILDSLAGLGEISAVSGSLEKAVAVSSFVVQHPVVKPLARTRGEQVMAQLKNRMPVEAWQAAKTRGENGTLEDFTAEFLSQT